MLAGWSHELFFLSLCSIEGILTLPYPLVDVILCQQNAERENTVVESGREREREIAQGQVARSQVMNENFSGVGIKGHRR